MNAGNTKVRVVRTAAFRADASVEIGTGHVMRCLTLADALRDKGVRCRFITRAHHGHLASVISARGHDVSLLPLRPLLVPPGGTSQHPYAEWLGADPESDANDTATAIRHETADCLIVDHYAIDATWECMLRSSCGRVMAIDDLADRPHCVDVLLDQNWFGEEGKCRYDHLLPATTHKLLGPSYALLGAQFEQLRSHTPARNGYVHRVLVFLGGSDPANDTATVLAAFRTPELSRLALDVVIGANHPDPSGISRLVDERPHTFLHQNLPSLAPLMARADLMVSAGGSTTWERMCLGLPAVVISIARNQTATNLALMRAGYISFLGERDSITPEGIRRALVEAISTPQQLARQSERAQTLVPGNGTRRVCDLLLGNLEHARA